MNFKKIVKQSIIVMAIFASLAAPAAAQTIDEIIQRGKVIIAVDVTTPPYGGMDTDGVAQGHEPDVARAIAKHLGVEAELVPVTAQNRIPFLLSNRVDMVISLFSITPERAKQVWFSIPYGYEASVLVAPKEMNIAKLEDLAGMRVAVPRGTGQDTMLTEANMADVTIMRYDDESAAVQAMLSGQVDVLGTGSLVHQQMNLRQPGKDYENKIILRAFHQGAAVRRGETDLLQWLNTTIYYMKNTGELDAIRRKNLNQSLPSDLPTF